MQTLPVRDASKMSMNGTDSATASRRGAGTAGLHPVPSQSPTPDQCVNRAKAGDPGAFEELYRQHVGRVYALCLRMSGDAREAEELTQDAFVRAWEKLESFRGQSAFSSWLHRLTVNVVLGRWRSKGRQRDRIVAIGDAEEVRRRHVEPRKGLALDLESAIRGLPAGARTIFVLHDIEGYRHRDIAELTGLAEGTSKTQLHRARRLLRKVLGP